MMLGHWSDLILYSTALQSFSVDSDNPDQSLHDFKVQLASPTPPTDSSIIQQSILPICLCPATDSNAVSLNLPTCTQCRTRYDRHSAQLCSPLYHKHLSAAVPAGTCSGRNGLHWPHTMNRLHSHKVMAFCIGNVACNADA